MAVLPENLTESFILLPVLVAFLLLGLIIAIIIVLRRRQENQPRVDTFLPPFVGGVPPKEETYVVPRDWKPSGISRDVYAPLSIPIATPERHTGGNRLMQSIIRVLPPNSGNFV